MDEPLGRSEVAKKTPQPPYTAAPQEPPLTPGVAWRNALAITLLGCLILGVGNMILLAGTLVRTTDLLTGSIWLTIGFTVSFGLIAGLIVAWQRSHGSSLAALGWGKPTTVLALALGVGFGIMWL